MLALSSHRAYLWHQGLEEWMCVAEEAHTSSAYMPTMRLQGQGGWHAPLERALGFGSTWGVLGGAVRCSGVQCSPGGEQSSRAVAGRSPA